MKELTVKAVIENIDVVTNFVNHELENTNCSAKTQMQINIAIDELFSNIARYAYDNEDGLVTIRMEFTENPPVFKLTFIDCGIPYNPLTRDDPNITLSAEEREIGGFGIFMVKKTMDAMKYEYKDQKNVLTICKNLS